MKHSINIFLLALLLNIASGSFAQQDTTVKKDEVSFKIGVFYNSNLNYYGRTDSLRSSGVFPVAELWLNKNFYISAAPVFVNNAVSSFEYAGTVTSIGYSTKSKNEKSLSNIFLTIPIYQDNSQLVQSALKAQLNSNFSWLNKWININAGGDIKYSDKLDFGVNAGLDHLFRYEIKRDIVLAFDPSAYIYAGTQRFTNSYYKKSSFLFFPGTEQEITEEVNKLNILSYEFSMPVVLGNSKWQLILNPAYVLPQNLITVKNRPDLSERGTNMFYITAGAKIIF